MKNFRPFLSLPALACFSSLLLLFLFPAAVLAGAKSGLSLWFQIVLPTLLPFLIVTNLCMELRIPELLPPSLYPAFVGLLSGYPVGAKACADLCLSGQLQPIEGQFFLSFCNNASPMFVLNYLFLQSLHLEGKLLLPSLLFYGSTFLSGGLFYFVHRQELKNAAKPHKQLTKNHAKQTGTTAAPAFFPALDASILTGFTIITKIGGYILLFSILASLVSAFLPASPAIKGTLIGLLEITTGISYLAKQKLPESLLLSLTLALTAFGGFSSVAQTNSVLSGSGLSISIYLKYKALAALICIGLCVLINVL